MTNTMDKRVKVLLEVLGRWILACLAAWGTQIVMLRISLLIVFTLPGEWLIDAGYMKYVLLAIGGSYLSGLVAFIFTLTRVRFFQRMLSLETNSMRSKGLQ